MIMGGRKYEISPEEHIFAAIMVFAHFIKMKNPKFTVINCLLLKIFSNFSLNPVGLRGLLPPGHLLADVLQPAQLAASPHRGSGCAVDQQGI